MRKPSAETVRPARFDGRPPSQPLGHELIGGRYRVQRLLGQGGMGAVYAVGDSLTGERLALKRLSATAGTLSLTLFEREFRTLAQLRHPHIVEVFEYGVDPDGPFYTMEVLEGSDLSGAAPMPWREVCACLRDLASILGVLHARQLVHRDLSPKNLFRGPDGRLRLLDFGALAPFGVSKEVVGTPPFVAPEALKNLPLDPRTDLFSLGALGFWLLTSTHAFRATALGDLRLLWTRAPATPSSLVKMLSGTACDVPPELDQLIRALLNIDPMERPATTEDVIDRLNSIAGLQAEDQSAIHQGYLESKVLVGRDRERVRFMDALVRAGQGDAQAMFVEGPQGVGRTRLLEEFATTARISGTLVLQANATAGEQRYAAARVLALQLLRQRPNLARRAAEPHASVICRLSSELAAALGNPAPASPLPDASDERARNQSTLASWILGSCQNETVVIIADDADAMDEESQALLSTLEKSGSRPRLLLVASATCPAPASAHAGLRSFRRSAQRLCLLSFTKAETHSLLRSLFGQVPYLSRLSTRLQGLSGGHPGHTMVLAEYLVRIGAAHYVDGSWHLPTDLPAAGLPASFAAGLLTRLEGLDDDARKLARCLSISDSGPLPLESCPVLAGLGPQATGTALNTMRRHGLLYEVDAGVGIAHEPVRAALYEELDSAGRANVHRTMASLIIAGEPDSPFLQLVSSLHLARAGDIAAAEARLVFPGRHYTQDFESLREAAPLFEKIVALLRDAGRPPGVLLMPLSVLAGAGYFVDRKYAAQFGEQAVSALETALHLTVARRLKPIVGAKASLVLALATAGARLLMRRHHPNLEDVIRCLMVAAGTVGGVAVNRIDGETAERYAEVMRPFTALGNDHAANLAYRFSKAVALTCYDPNAATQRELQKIIDRLLSSKPIALLPESAKRTYLAGAHMAYGYREGFTSNESVLRRADRLDTLGPLAEMFATQLRADYAAGRGDLGETAKYMQRLEALAIQMGSAWQVETWGPTDATRAAYWSHDAVALRRAAQQLDSLALTSPSLTVHGRWARGAYMVLRGRYQQALHYLEGAAKAPHPVGWIRVRGILAAAYNGLGQHKRARQVCLAALAELPREELPFVGMTLNVQVELALADAALGDFRAAGARLDGLLKEQSQWEGPLVLATVHRAHSRVALLQRDCATARRHLEAMTGWARQTSIPTLLEYCETLNQELRRAETPVRVGRAGALAPDETHLMTRVGLLMAEAGPLKTVRATRALQIALELTGADGGCIRLASRQRAVAEVGDIPTEGVVLDWLQGRLAALQNGEQDTTQLDEFSAASDNGLDEDAELNTLVVGSRGYCMVPVWLPEDSGMVTVAALLLSFLDGDCQTPPGHVLQMIAEMLGGGL